MFNIPEPSGQEDIAEEQAAFEKASLNFATATAQEFGYPEGAIGSMIQTTNPGDLQFGDVVFFGPQNAHHTSARSWTIYTVPEGDSHAGIGQRWNKQDMLNMYYGVPRANIHFPDTSEPVFIIRNGVDMPTF